MHELLSSSGVPVRLRFRPGIRHRTEQPLWQEPPLVLRRANGTVEVHGCSSNLPDLVRYVLSYGADVEVVCPPWLRAYVASEAQRVHMLYTHDT